MEPSSEEPNLLEPPPEVLETWIPDIALPSGSPGLVDGAEEQVGEVSTPEKSEGVVMKPTFKSALQAKKRLQAFSVHKPGSLPTSPLAKKPKLGLEDAKTEEGASTPKKTSRKGKVPTEKAKSVIEEIEEMKRFAEEIRKHEQEAFFEVLRQSKRSRSRSHDKERFKKVEKKSRNYRRRSSSPDRHKRSPSKRPKKYPRSWKEFFEGGFSFDVLRDFDVTPPKGQHNELCRQLSFELPSLPINQFRMKAVNREEKIVPFDYIRYTRAKPQVSYSVNCTAIKQSYLSKKDVFNVISKDRAATIEKLYSNSIKFKTDPGFKGKSRPWYPRRWRELSGDECQLLENSVGLSFLQSYTGEDEDNEILEEETVEELPGVGVSMTEDYVEWKSSEEAGEEPNPNLTLNADVEFRLSKGQEEVDSSFNGEVDLKSSEEVPVKKVDSIKEVNSSREVDSESNFETSALDASQEGDSNYKEVESTVEYVDPRPTDGSKLGVEIDLKLDQEVNDIEPIERKSVSKDVELNKELENEDGSRESKKKKRKKSKKGDEVAVDELGEVKIKKKKKKKRSGKENRAASDEADVSEDKRKKKKRKKDKTKKEKRVKEKPKKKKTSKEKKKKEKPVEDEVVVEKPEEKPAKKKEHDSKSRSEKTEKLVEKVEKSRKRKNSDCEGDAKRPKREKSKRESDTSHNDSSKSELKKIDKEHRRRSSRSESFELVKDCVKKEDGRRSDSFEHAKESARRDDSRRHSKSVSLEVEKHGGRRDDGRRSSKMDGFELVKDSARRDDGGRKSNRYDSHDLVRESSGNKLSRFEDTMKDHGKKENRRSRKSDSSESVKDLLKKIDDWKVNAEDGGFQLVKDFVRVDDSRRGSRFDGFELKLDIKQDSVRDLGRKKPIRFESVPELVRESSRNRSRFDSDVQESVKESRRRPSRFESDVLVVVDEESHVKKQSRFDSEEWDKKRPHRLDHVDLLEPVKVSSRKRPSRFEPIDVDVEKKPDGTEMKTEDVKKKEDTTPDTDEYHSHWETDDDASSSVAPRQQPIKVNRSWESDEELFERTYNRNKAHPNTYDNLEIPLNLNIKTSSRRVLKSKWDEKPSAYIDVESELKLLEVERKNLSEERKMLEIEKERVKKLQERTDFEFKERGEDTKSVMSMRSSTPDFDLNRVKVEKTDVVNDFSIDSLNNSLLSNVSSVESTSFPIAALENEYEEFIKAVSSDSSAQTKKKNKLGSASYSSDSSSSSSSSSGSSRKRKKRKSKKKKRKLKLKNSIFNEFDIPVPGDLPEVIPIVPAPVPVPSPLETVLAPPTALLFNPTMLDLVGEKPAVEEEKKEGIDLSKPFVFSSITLPSKKPLLDNSNLKLGDDSDSADFTDKFVKKLDFKDEDTQETAEELLTVTKEETDVTKLDSDVDHGPVASEPETPPPAPEEAPPEKPPPEQKPRPPSPSPPAERKSTDRGLKERRRSRSRERDSRRRSPVRRREASPPGRRRFLSPRRRSPLPPRQRPLSPRRRPLSPRRRSPSPRRRSPSPRRRSISPRRRSLSPRRRSLSPRRRLSPLPRARRFRSPRRSPSPGLRRSLSPRPRGGSRKRTPSPRSRRGSSPLNSPLDGFKRSVADSTISDDMLPQPTPDDYVESPPSYASKYYDRKPRRSSLSPMGSPKRMPLDDRINQVLGLEKHEHKLSPMVTEVYHSYGYGHQYDQQHQYGQFSQYSQYTQQKSDYPPYRSPYAIQPPPPPPPLPVAKPLQTSTKVVQVGNILQVVPTEEISTPNVAVPPPTVSMPPPAMVIPPPTMVIPPPTMVENKLPDLGQKIVQVGNMLQIVPGLTPTVQPVIKPPPLPVVQVPEKPSAEAVMKQKIAERKAERDKRRLERELRRKEKEKKRKEKEKQKQIKLKLKTEDMIKKALQLEAEDAEEEDENAEAPIQWPPVPVIITGASSATPTKGILIAGGFSKLERKSSRPEKKKSVQFADGIRPGEGTSPSGGEDLSSPPPVPVKLPKEKRYKKTKVQKKSKKKKIKVKVIKKVQQTVEEEADEDEEEENLPPPSPPPGSPPPHVFPSRVKTHTINNVHQFMVPTSGAYVGAYRPQMPPIVISRGPPPPPHGAAYMPPPGYHTEVHNLSHPPPSHGSYPLPPPTHGVSSHH